MRHHLDLGAFDVCFSLLGIGVLQSQRFRKIHESTSPRVPLIIMIHHDTHSTDGPNYRMNSCGLHHNTHSVYDSFMIINYTIAVDHELACSTLDKANSLDSGRVNHWTGTLGDPHLLEARRGCSIVWWRSEHVDTEAKNLAYWRISKPLVMTHIAIEHGPVEIVSFPINKCDVP